METPRQEYLQRLADLYKNAMTVLVQRGAKYATDENPFQNFQESARFAGVSVEQGILTRLGDKYGRLRNLFKNGATFDDESVQDTFTDIINYNAILCVWYAWGREVYTEDVFTEDPDELTPDRYMTPATSPTPAEPTKTSWLTTMFKSRG